MPHKVTFNRNAGLFGVFVESLYSLNTDTKWVRIFGPFNSREEAQSARKVILRSFKKTWERQGYTELEVEELQDNMRANVTAMWERDSRDDEASTPGE